MDTPGSEMLKAPSLTRRQCLTGMLAGTAGLALMGAASPLRAAGAATVRVGVLPFGTVNWELAAMAGGGFARGAGIDLQIMEVASPTAGQIALQSNAVDVIASDWIWVARQRSSGQDLSFVPYSSAVGSIVVPKGSAVQGIADLAGKRIGIAGGPLDKGWLLLRAQAGRAHGLDLMTAAEPVFGAPPLLSQQLEAGRLDAVLTYWHYAARLAAKGHRELIGVAELAGKLGLEADVPMLGYVFRTAWAKENPAAIEGFIQASRDAKALLRDKDEAWGEIEPLMKADDQATFEALRAGFRAGIPERWTERERKEAEKLFAILAELGGRDLVGSATSVPEGTFWPVDWDNRA